MVNLAAFRVVPESWAARHRPIVAGFFPDRVHIERPTGRTVTDSLGTKVTLFEQVTDQPIPALVQVVQSTLSPDRRESGNQPISVTDYTARLDVEWLPLPGDRLIVVESPDPANLGTYVVHRRESQGHVVDRTVHLERVAADGTR